MSAKLLFGNGRGNSKLSQWKYLFTFSLPAGRACPFAKACKSQVDIIDGRTRIVDGPHTQFRCFGASGEVRSKNLRIRSAMNYDLVNATGRHDRTALANLIDRSIPAEAIYIRIHTTGGDFLTEEYLGAWVDVAKQYPEMLFYGYTKALPYYVSQRNTFPDNLRLTPSRGGTHDEMIDECGLHEARVIFHPSEAEKLGWPIDHDDVHAMAGDHSFCLLLHGVQPKGGQASAALKLMKSEGIKHGYSSRSRKG